ncbi:hypothetical protein F5B20DRAFT_575551 [Whalleya microplaca]|nr:hypothetical protein F5B20DRAFT_575551 [Whalleya microplaca]
MARIYNAIVRYPENISGDNGFCIILVDAYGGAITGKGGENGFYAISVRESEETRWLGAKGGIGIALKIEDGNGKYGSVWIVFIVLK